MTITISNVIYYDNHMDEATIKTELGLRIRSYRNQKNLSQEKFCNLIGLDQPNFSNIENGKALPAITTLCSIIHKGGVDPNYLLGFLREEDNVKYDSVDFAILRLIIDLPDASKEHLKNFLLSLPKK